MIIIVFGLAASGKTYVGKLIAKHFGYHHEDADQWLLDDMKQAIEQKQNFTLEMLDGFTKNVIKHIKNLSHKYPNLVISQAFYRQENRDKILKNFPEENLIFIQVDANDKVILKRLKSRGDWVDEKYAAEMRRYFEAMDQVKIINNDRFGEYDIIRQLEEILAKKREVN